MNNIILNQPNGIKVYAPIVRIYNLNMTEERRKVLKQSLTKTFMEFRVS